MSNFRYYAMAAAGAAATAACLLHWIRAHRKTPEQREMERRQRLSIMGRITDGTLLDIQEIAHNGSPLQMLIYSYDVAGVSYEASQDITNLREYVDLHTCRLGLPASIKYDPHNPGDSIVVSERWIGLRR